VAAPLGLCWIRRAFAADARDVPARGMRQRKLAIDVAQLNGHSKAVHLAKQNCSSGFNHRHGSVAQDV